MTETETNTEKPNNLGRTPRVQRVYDTGMQLSNALRLVGMHEESNDLEAWVLSVVNELTMLDRRE